jgi:hypothetical protein
MCSTPMQLSARLLIGVAAIAAAGVARATITYGNMGEGLYHTTTGGQSIFTPNGYQFTATASGTLSEIDMGLNGGGSFSLALYLDNSGTIGALEWTSPTLTNVPNSGIGAPSFAIPVSGGPDINAGSTYWLVGSNGAPDAADNLPLWAPNTTGAAGLWYSLENGIASYQATAAIGAFQVNVAPEPSTLILATLGALTLLAYRRRR